MPGVLEEIGLTRLPHFTALRNSFATISINDSERFSAEVPRNATATPRSTQLASTAISPRGITPNGRTTAFGR